MRAVMLHQHNAALRELRAQLQQEVGFGDGPHDGDRVHLLGPRARQFQASGDGLFRRTVGAAPMSAPPDQLGFLHGGDQFAVLQNGAGGVAQNAADSENDHTKPTETPIQTIEPPMNADERR